MIGKLNFFIIISLFFTSCDKAIFIDKKNVIHNQKGFIIYYYEDEAVFFPTKDSLEDTFLKSDHLNGYRIGTGEKGVDYLRKVASTQKIIENIKRDNESLKVEKQIKLIPVTVKYYWGDNFNLKLQRTNNKTNSIFFEYNAKQNKLNYQLSDYRYIVSISAIRKSDVIKIDSLLN